MPPEISRLLEWCAERVAGTLRITKTAITDRYKCLTRSFGDFTL
jgi:hypothetical protein